MNKITSKFIVLTESTETSVDNAVFITKAVGILHNMMIQKEGMGMYFELTGENDANEVQFQVTKRKFTRLASNIRPLLNISYLMKGLHPGEITW